MRAVILSVTGSARSRFERSTRRSASARQVRSRSWYDPRYGTTGNRSIRNHEFCCPAGGTATTHKSGIGSVDRRGDATYLSGGKLDDSEPRGAFRNSKLLRDLLCVQCNEFSGIPHENVCNPRGTQSRCLYVRRHNAREYWWNWIRHATCTTRALASPGMLDPVAIGSAWGE